MKRLVVVGLIGIVTIALSLAWAAGDAAKGKTTYGQMCAGCHGSSGKGDGPAAASLNPKPTDLTNKATGLNDADLKKVIKGGGQAIGKSPAMPALGAALKGPDVDNLVAYLRSLEK